MKKKEVELILESVHEDCPWFLTHKKNALHELDYYLHNLYLNDEVTYKLYEHHSNQLNAIIKMFNEILEITDKGEG